MNAEYERLDKKHKEIQGLIGKETNPLIKEALHALSSQVYGDLIESMC
tara:strand:+ start:572 stop:715 length:144 start_codon:yes stop_codon:yes gene_type:complete